MKSTGRFADSSTRFYRRLVLAEWPTNKSNRRTTWWEPDWELKNYSCVQNPWSSNTRSSLANRITSIWSSPHAGTRKDCRPPVDRAIWGRRDDLTQSRYTWSSFMSVRSVLVLITVPRRISHPRPFQGDSTTYKAWLFSGQSWCNLTPLKPFHTLMEVIIPAIHSMQSELNWFL